MPPLWSVMKRYKLVSADKTVQVELTEKKLLEITPSDLLMKTKGNKSTMHKVVSFALRMPWMHTLFFYGGHSIQRIS